MSSCKLIKTDDKIVGVINEFGEQEPYFNVVLADIIKKGVTHPSLSQDELAAKYTELAMENRKFMELNSNGSMKYDSSILNNVKFQEESKKTKQPSKRSKSTRGITMTVDEINTILSSGKTFPISDFLENIRTNGSQSNKFIINLLTPYIEPILKNLKFTVIADEKFMYGGFYVNGNIVVNLKKTRNAEDTFIHELMHALTADLITKGSKKDKSLTTVQQKAYDDLVDLYEAVKSRAKQENSGRKYGLTNLDEFVAEAFSNRDFQRFLMSYDVPSNKRKRFKAMTLFEKFVNIIESLFNFGGFSKIDLEDKPKAYNNKLSETVLENLFYTTIELLSDGVTVTNSEVALAAQAADAIDIEQLDKSSKLVKANIVKEVGTGTEESTVKIGNRIYNRITDKVAGFFSWIMVNPYKSRDEYIIKKAEAIWKNHDPETRLKVSKFTGIDDPTGQNSYTMAEYIEARKQQDLVVQMAGRLKHAIVESIFNLERQDEILATINEYRLTLQNLTGKDYSQHGEWILNKMAEIKAKLNIAASDKIYTEMSIINEKLGLVGTMDLLVKHDDGTYSIYDWKFGKHFMNETSNKLLKYGRFGKVLSDPQDFAKIQLLLYAISLKMQYPDVQFRNLQVVHLPNEDSVKWINNKGIVDIERYLPVIEEFFKDSKAQVELGLIKEGDKSLYDQVTAVNKNVFKKQTYYVNQLKPVPDSVNMNTKLTGNRESDWDIIAKELSTIEERMETDPNSIHHEDKVKYANLATKAMEINMRGDSQIERESKDTDLLTRVWLNLKDVNHPLAVFYRRFLDQALLIRNKRKLEIQTKVQGLLKHVYQPNQFLDKVGLSIIKPKEQNAKYMVEELIPGQDGVTRVRMLHDAEVLPELKSRWEALTAGEREFLTALNDYYKDIGTRYFKSLAVSKNVDGNLVQKTIIDQYNSYVPNVEQFEWYPGWFPKVPKQPHEIRQDLMNEPDFLKAGANYIKEGAVKMLTDFAEDEYENKNMPLAIPLRYLDKFNIVRSQNHSMDLYHAFKVYSDHIEHKQSLQPVYGLAQAIKMKLALETYKDQYGKVTGSFDYIIGMIDDTITNEIKLVQKEVLTYKATVGDKVAKFGEGKTIRAINNLSGATLIAMKPFTAAGNFIHGILTVKKEVFNYAIGQFVGLTKNDYDFIQADEATSKHAWKEYLDLEKDAAMGNIRNNKLWLMGKTFAYLPDNILHNFMDSDNYQNLRLLDPSNLAVLSKKSEHALAWMTLVMQMNHLTHTYNGVTKTVYDWYEAENGTLVWKGGSRAIKTGVGTYEKTEIIRGLADEEIVSLKKQYALRQGNYRTDEKNFLDTYVMLSIFNTFKRYLPRIINDTFKQMSSDPFLGKYKLTQDGQKVSHKREDGTIEEIDVYEWHARITEGKFRTLVKSIVLLSTGRIEDLRKLHPEQKKNLIDAMVTLTLAGLAFVLMNGMFDDDDEDNALRIWWERYLIENLAQQYILTDLGDAVYKYGNPASARWAMDFGGGMLRTMVSLIQLAYGDEKAALTPKGELEGFKDLKKNVPYAAFIYDFAYKVESSKDLQQFLGFKDEKSFSSYISDNGWR